ENSLHNYFQFTIGAQGPPCGAFCQQKTHMKQHLRELKNKFVNLQRKLEFINFNVDQLSNNTDLQEGFRMGMDTMQKLADAAKSTGIATGKDFQKALGAHLDQDRMLAQLKKGYKLGKEKLVETATSYGKAIFGQEIMGGEKGMDADLLEEVAGAKVGEGDNEEPGSGSMGPELEEITDEGVFGA
ncbi:unnamed protein product, partial [Amoebophrya sp. A25]